MTVSDLSRGAKEPVILTGEIRDQLNRILDCSEFRATPQRKAFLQYILEEYIAGRHERLKGFAIALAVYGRDEKFDPQLDPIVRLEAGRLRRDLEHYYLTAGRLDPIIIDLPKGAYVPLLKRSESVATEPVTAAPEVTLPEVCPPEISSGEHASAKSQRPTILLASGGLALCVIAIAAAFWVWKPETGGLALAVPSAATREPAPSTPQRMFSVAVMPFAMVNGSAEDRYFAEGLSHEMAKSLSRFQSIAVVPPSSIMGGGAQSGNARAALGVNYILEGTVEKAPDTIRVSARLVDSLSNHLIWADSYQRELDTLRIFEIREEMSLKIAANIGSNHGVLILDSLARTQLKPPEHFVSFECMLRFYQHQIRAARESHLRVRACLERTVERDPDYAAAWASLSNVYAQEYRLGLNPITGRHPSAPERALRAAQRAVELVPGDATAALMLANAYFDHDDYAEFRQFGEAAIRLSPGDPNVLAHFGMRLTFIGHWERGLSLVQRAIDISASHPPWYHYPFAFHHYLHGAYEPALSAAQKVWPLGLFGYDFFAAMSFAQSDQPERAREAAHKLVAAHPNASAKFWDQMHAWKFRPADVENMAGGLRKAGVPIGPQPDRRPLRIEATAQ